LDRLVTKSNEFVPQQQQQQQRQRQRQMKKKPANHKTKKQSAFARVSTRASSIYNESYLDRSELAPGRRMWGKQQAYQPPSPSPK
jgi:hypothetical protein